MRLFSRHEAARLLNLGTQGASPGDATRVQLINTMAALSVVICAVSLPAHALSGAWSELALTLATGVWLGLVLGLHARGHQWGAAFAFSLTALWSVNVVFWGIGFTSGVQTFLIPAALLPFVAFSFRDTATAVILAGLCLSSYIAMLQVLVQDAPAVFFAIDSLYAVNVVSMVTMVGLISYASRAIASRSEASVQEEREKSEAALLALLPASIAAELRQERVSREDTAKPRLAQRHDEVSVLFACVLDTSEHLKHLRPQEMVHLLNALFTSLDLLCLQHGVEKIKTDRNMYMVAAGVPTATPNHAERLVLFALAMREVAAEVGRQETGQPLVLRVGLHSGPVVAGVLGQRRFTYDLWGDTVNTAQRMQAHGLPDEVQVSADTWRRVAAHFHGDARPELVNIKGKGQMQTWLIRQGL